MSDIIQEGELVEVKVTIRVPKAASADQVEAWLRYCLHDNGSLELDNPLSNFEPEAWGNSGLDLIRLWQIGTRQEFNHRECADGSRHYSVRYHRKPILAQSRDPAELSQREALR